MSKSWMVKSRNRPPEVARNCISGRPGSRLVMITCSTLPIAPASRRCLSERKLGSKRRLKPTNIGTLRFFHRRDAGFDLGQRQIDRLFAEDRLAGLCRGDRQIGVAAGGRSDEHCLHRGIAERFGFGGLARAERLRERARGFGLGVDDVEQLRVAAAHEVLRVHAADASRAEQGEGDHWTGSAFPLFSDLIAASASTSAWRPSCAPTGIGCSCLQGIDERGQLDAIGLGVALEEEVERPVAHRALGRELLDRGLAEVLGAQQALRAEHLDALVVAVHRAARIVDVAHLVRGGAQDQHRRVDVAGLGDLRVDERLAPRRTPRPALRRAASAPCRSRGSSCRGTCRPRP